MGWYVLLIPRFFFGFSLALRSISGLTLLGPGYRSDEVFNVRKMEPYSLQFLRTEFSLFTENMVLYLPRTSNLKQLAKEVKDDRKVMVMHYCMETSSKALCVYYGGFTIH